MEENSLNHSNHTGTMGRTVMLGHSAFVFCVFLPVTEDKLKLLRNMSHRKRWGFQINISSLDNTKNEHQLTLVPHPLFRSSLHELWPALPASGESNFHTQQLRFGYSLQFVSKQTLFCFGQSLSKV